MSVVVNHSLFPGWCMCEAANFGGLTLYCLLGYMCIHSFYEDEEGKQYSVVDTSAIKIDRLSTMYVCMLCIFTKGNVFVFICSRLSSCSCHALGDTFQGSSESS